MAFRPSEDQKEPLEVLGEWGVCGLSVWEAQQLRKALEEECREKERLAGRVAELEGLLTDGRRRESEAQELAGELGRLRGSWLG